MFPAPRRPSPPLSRRPRSELTREAPGPGKGQSRPCPVVPLPVPCSAVSGHGTGTTRHSSGTGGRCLARAGPSGRWSRRPRAIPRGLGRQKLPAGPARGRLREPGRCRAERSRLAPSVDPGPERAARSGAAPSRPHKSTLVLAP